MIKPNDIITNPTLINQMSLNDIQSFNQHFYKRRIDKGIRESVETHKKEILFEIKQQKSNSKLQKKLYALYVRIDGIHKSIPQKHDFRKDDEDLIKYHGRSISNDLYDLPFIFTGMESKQCVRIKNIDPSYKPVEEHLWPRQWCGEYIVRMFLDHEKQFTISELVKLVYRYSHVHYVTKEENQLLRPYQKVSTFESPEESYKLAGIEMVRTQDKQIPLNWRSSLDYFCK